MGDSGHNRHVPKRKIAVSLSRELGPRLLQRGLGRGLLQYQAASSSIQRFGYNRHGPKIGWEWVCPFFWGVAGSTSNTMSRRTRPTSIPSGILIHPAVWHNRHSPKIGSCAHFGEAGSPSNTRLPAAKPTSIPSGILIHSVIWPQQIWAEI